VAREHSRKPPGEILNEVVQAVEMFAQGPLPDDLTLVAVSGSRGEAR